MDNQLEDHERKCEEDRACWKEPCSFQEQAQKNHYLMERIADFIKQLYEYFYLKKNEIKKLQKNIFPKWQALK